MTTGNIVTAAAITLSSMLTALAGDLYVATTENGGDDSNLGTSVAPLATVSAAITAAKAAIDSGETAMTIHIGDGDYLENSLTLDAAITITGNAANPSAVRVGKASSTSGRVFTLSAAGATLANLTVRNGKNTLGSNINMIAGTMVTNCIVTGGQSVVTGSQDYSGNIYMTGGAVSGCEVKNGLCSALNNNSAGFGIYASRGLIENCYIHGNCGGANGGVTGGVDLRWAAYLVNCTVADNYDSKDKTEVRVFQVRAGSASARVVNCVIFEAVNKTGGICSSDNGSCYYGCAASEFDPRARECVVIGATAFMDADNGGYRPASVPSPLVDRSDR